MILPQLNNAIIIFIHLCIYLFIYIFMYLFIYLFICLFIYLLTNIYRGYEHQSYIYKIKSVKI